MRPVIVVAVIFPTAGSGTPLMSAAGVRLLLGFLKLGWFRTLIASIRICSLPCSHAGIPKLLLSEKSTSVRPGPRHDVLGLFPKVFSPGTQKRTCLNHPSPP